MAGNISLGSTQKAGEGDAFIYDNSGANRNIGILAQQNAQEKQQKAAEETQKKKQDYDTQKAFYDNLSSINTIGIRPQDVDFVNQRIAKILEYTNDAKMQGKNPLDMSNSTEYMKLMTDLNSLDAYASGSKSLFKEDNAYINDINTNKDGMFDFGKSMEAYEERSKMPLDQAINFSLKPVLQKFNGQAFLTKNLTPTLLKTITPYLKVYSDKTAQADAQLQLDGVKERYTPIIDQMLFSTGRYTEDEIPEQRDKYLSQLGFKALYDDNKDEDQVLARDKFNLDDWFKRQKVAQGWEKIDLQKKSIAKTDTNLEQMFIDMANGKGSTTLFNNKPNFEEMATDDNGNPLLDKNDNPIPTVYGKVTNRAYIENGATGFLIEYKNPTTGKVQGTKFIKTQDNNGNSVITQTSAYQNMQDYMLKNGYKYVGASGLQMKPNQSSNTITTSSTTQGNLGSGASVKMVPANTPAGKKTYRGLDNNGNPIYK